MNMFFEECLREFVDNEKVVEGTYGSRSIYRLKVFLNIFFSSIIISGEREPVLIATSDSEIIILADDVEEVYEQNVYVEVIGIPHTEKASQEQNVYVEVIEIPHSKKSSQEQNVYVDVIEISDDDDDDNKTVATAGLALI